MRMNTNREREDASRRRSGVKGTRERAASAAMIDSKKKTASPVPLPVHVGAAMEDDGGVSTVGDWRRCKGGQKQQHTGGLSCGFCSRKWRSSSQSLLPMTVETRFDGGGSAVVGVTVNGLISFQSQFKLSDFNNMCRKLKVLY